LVHSQHRGNREEGKNMEEENDITRWLIKAQFKIVYGVEGHQCQAEIGDGLFLRWNQQRQRFALFSPGEKTDPVRNILLEIPKTILTLNQAQKLIEGIL